MSNEFIEELRKKARELNEEDYRERIKQEYPWLKNDAINEKVFVDALTRIFNQKEGEER